MSQRIIVITGGSRGIGAASAKLFAERGDHVYILDIREPQTDLAKLSNLKYIECDVSQYHSVQSGFEKIKKERRKKSGRI